MSSVKKPRLDATSSSSSSSSKRAENWTAWIGYKDGEWLEGLSKSSPGGKIRLGYPPNTCTETEWIIRPDLVSFEIEWQAAPSKIRAALINLGRIDSSMTNEAIYTMMTTVANPDPSARPKNFNDTLLCFGTLGEKYDEDLSDATIEAMNTDDGVSIEVLKNEITSKTGKTTVAFVPNQWKPVRGPSMSRTEVDNAYATAIPMYNLDTGTVDQIMYRDDRVYYLLPSPGDIGTSVMIVVHAKKNTQHWSSLTLVDLVVNTLDWISPVHQTNFVAACHLFRQSDYKSLLQKLVRTHCTDLVYETEVSCTRESGTIEPISVNVGPANVAIALCMASLIASPPSFNPEIKRSVNGIEACAKRLAVIVVEDGFVPDAAFSRTTQLLLAAYVSKTVYDWQPSLEMIRDWINFATTVQQDSRIMIYNATFHARQTVLPPDVRVYTPKETLPRVTAKLARILLENLGAFEGDKQMFRDIENGTAMYYTPSPNVYTRPDIVRMSTVQYMDQHVDPSMALLLPVTPVPSSVSKSMYPFAGSMQKIWQVTGFNPRLQHPQKIFPRGIEPNAQTRRDVEFAQRCGCFLIFGIPKFVAPEADIIASNASQIQFQSKIHPSWYAALAGVLNKYIQSSENDDKGKRKVKRANNSVLGAIVGTGDPITLNPRNPTKFIGTPSDDSGVVNPATVENIQILTTKFKTSGFPLGSKTPFKSLENARLVLSSSSSSDGRLLLEYNNNSTTRIDTANVRETATLVQFDRDCDQYGHLHAFDPHNTINISEYISTQIGPEETSIARTDLYRHAMFCAIAKPATMAIQNRIVHRHAPEILVRTFSAYKVKTQRRIMYHLGTYEPTIELPRIARDGGSSYELVTEEDVYAYEYMTLVAYYAPCALARVNARTNSRGSIAKFSVTYAPYLWSLVGRLRDHLAVDTIALSVSETTSDDELRETSWFKLDAAFIDGTGPFAGDNPGKTTTQINIAAQIATDAEDARQGHFIWMGTGMGKTRTSARAVYTVTPMHVKCGFKYVIFTTPKAAIQSVAMEYRNILSRNTKIFIVSPLNAKNATTGNPMFVEMTRDSSNTICKHTIHRKISPETLGPCVMFIDHDHLRNLPELFTIIDLSIFIVDEAHKMMADTIRTGTGLQLADAAQRFIAMTATPVINNDKTHLIKWLRGVNNFRVDAASFYVAVNGIVLSAERTNNERRELTINYDISRWMNEHNVATYLGLVPSRMGGTNDFATGKEFTQAYTMCRDAMVFRAIPEYTNRLLRENASARVFIVVESQQQAEEVGRILAQANESRTIFVLGGTNKINITESTPEYDHIRVVVTSKHNDTGYNLSTFDHMVTSVYPSNQATRTQLAGRIDRLVVAPKLRTYHKLVTGILEFIDANHQKAATLQAMVNMLASKI